MIDKCKYCGAPVLWIKPNDARSIPCNPQAVYYNYNEDGKSIIITNHGETIKCDITKYPDLSGLDLIGYVPHKYTCPVILNKIKKQNRLNNINQDKA